MKRFSLYALFSLFLILSFAACDSADDGDGDGNGGGVLGDANVTIDGDVEGSLSGSAVFGMDAPNNNFGIALFEGDFIATPTGEFVFIGYEGGRPGEGEYQISNDESDSVFVGVYTSDASNPTGGTLISAQNGTLTITSSSSDRVVGSFTFTGPVFSGTGTQGTATVAGSFDAELVEESDFPTAP